MVAERGLSIVSQAKRCVKQRGAKSEAESSEVKRGNVGERSMVADRRLGIVSGDAGRLVNKKRDPK